MVIYVYIYKHAGVYKGADVPDQYVYIIILKKYKFENLR